MSTPSEAHALERWLRTPWRRLVLVAIGVLVLAGTSTLLMADAMASVEREFDLWFAFRRRLIQWGLWGLCFEPLLGLSALLSRILKPAILVLLVHAGLSVACTFGLHEADRFLEEAWLPNEQQGFFGRGGGRGPGRRPDWADRERFGEERQERVLTAQEVEDRAERRRPFEFGAARRGRHRWAESGIVVYWLIVGLGVAVRSYVSHRNQERRATGLELRAVRLEGELSTARLAQLEAQIHPHFLFNALHSVGGLVRDGQRKAALSTLSALGDLLRASLQHGAAAEAQLSDEFDLVEAYLDVERIRLGDRLEMVLEADPATNRALVPPLLLLPLVENSIKHAIAPRPEGGKLQLHATLEEGVVVIVLTDDGPGFPPGVLSGAGSEDGIGLANTKSRVQALYGMDAIRLENLDSGGARVTLRIPIDE